MSQIKDTREYHLISAHYINHVAKRSRVPLINHIDEGLTVLSEIGATEQSMRAYCLHPMLQGDKDLARNIKLVADQCDPYAIMLGMEYRSVANEYLSYKVNTGHVIRLSPLAEVNDMLIADKVQNYKDFVTYHRGKHQRSDQLDEYFGDWMKALNVDRYLMQHLWDVIDYAKERK